MENEVKTELRPEIEQAEGNITVKRNKTLDFLAKIICLILAFFLWYYAVSIDTVIHEEDFSEIPVEIINHGEYAVLSGDGITVDITLSGNRNVIRKIKNSDIRAYVDVSSVTEPGEKLFDIVFKLPNGATLEKSSVGTLTVYLDNKVSKTVPVEAKPFNYQMSSEYVLNLSNIPDVVITGPEQIISKIVRAELPVDLNNSEITSGRIYSGKVSLVGSDGSAISETDRRYVRLSSDTASVTVSLYGNASVPVAVTFKHGVQKPSSCSFALSTQSLNVFGEIGVIKNLTVNCVIDEKTLKNGVPVNCVVGLPSGVQNLDNVSSINVTVTFKNVTERELTVPVFDAYGNRITSITAKFRGESAVMQRLTTSSIKATVKASDVNTDSTSIPVVFEFLGEFSGNVYEIYREGSPYTVNAAAVAKKR
jgi:YbbR domain-containing protein